MLFNSVDFAIFLPVVFMLYWFFASKNLETQNIFILIASYFFYGFWDWRFLFLIVFSTTIDYVVGLGLSKQNNIAKRKLLLWTSIIINIGFLGFFKYYNFFLDSFTTAFSFFGSKIQTSSLHIILPVGISFYTFQTLSYSIDCYNKKITPTTNFIAFAAFVGFFPQLVAGPIERAINLLPQFYNKRKFNYTKALDGMRHILWGLFKKMVIADNCAEFVNLIFSNTSDYSGGTLILGLLFFSFQIYGDFSGYSDIAIGVSKLFGFNLTQNFKLPFFSRDIAEFWRRWHISLSTWFRDYIYIPLGGSRGSTSMKVRNTLIIFVISGFWHGANWTFVIWGAINGLFFLPILLTKKNRINIDIVAKGKLLPSFKDFISIIITFCLISFTWVFFRATSIEHALLYISRMFSESFFALSNLGTRKIPLITLCLIILTVMTEWITREQNHPFEFKNKCFPRVIRWSIYFIIIVIILNYSGGKQEFIYFQF